jgi:hypothetical protein
MAIELARAAAAGRKPNLRQVDATQCAIVSNGSIGGTSACRKLAGPMLPHVANATLCLRFGNVNETRGNRLQIPALKLIASKNSRRAGGVMESEFYLRARWS